MLDDAASDPAVTVPTVLSAGARSGDNGGALPATAKLDSAK
jgi:hypothetical protein